MKIKFTFQPVKPMVNLSVTLDKVNYVIDMLWLDVSEVWVATISHNGQALTSGRVVKNGGDLLGNVKNTGKLTFEGDEPTRNNIGRTCHMYYYEKANDL